MIKRDWKNPVLFCAENLTCWRTGGKSGGSCKAENLENLASGKSGKLDAENLRKNSLTGKSADPVQLRKICGESGKSGKSENVKYI